MANAPSDIVMAYCRTLTDKQLENMLIWEWEAYKHRDYCSVEKVAQERGWVVSQGKRIS